MKPHRPIVLAILLGGLAAHAEAQAPAKDPEVKVQLKALKGLMFDRKVNKDAEAKMIINVLHAKYDKMHPADQVAFAKGIAECLHSSRCKRKPERADLFRTTVVALGLLGKNGGKHLTRAYKNKSKFKGKEWITLRGEMLESLGNTKDEKQIDFLLDEALRSPVDALMAKAGGALVHFSGSKLKVRQDIAKELIRKFANIYGNAKSNLDPGDLQRQTWENRLAAVSDPWNNTLQKLTKQSIRRPLDWQRFYNKEKGKNWDKPKKTKRRK